MIPLQFRRTTISKTNAVYRDLAPLYKDAGGWVLCIDPSIGSKSSAPGYAVSVGGVVTESGTIDTGRSKTTHDRLYELGRTLREEFTTPSGDPWDLLIIEAIPAKRWRATGWGQRGSIKQQVQLHRAVGAVHASIRALACIEVHPATWHTVAPAGYVKSDEGDALCMLELVRQYAAYFAARAVTPEVGPRRNRTKSKAAK